MTSFVKGPVNAERTADAGSGWDDQMVQLWGPIRGHGAFDGIPDEELKKILGYFQVVTGWPGQILIQEGQHGSSDLLLVLEGSLEVSKKDLPENDTIVPEAEYSSFSLAKLSQGDIIGELSFITGNARSATIKSVTSSKLLSISRADFGLLEHNYPIAYARILKNMIGHIAERVKQTSTNEVKSLRMELEKSLLNSRSNLFFSYVIGLLCIYNLVIHYIISLSTDARQTSLISAIIIVLFAAGLVMMIRHSKIPLAIIGLTTKNWNRSLRESLPWTALIIGISILVKWILITNVPRYQHLHMFDLDLSNTYLAFNFILYGLHSPIQEFIARGVLQGSLQHFYTGKNVALRAVIVSNALFSATHVHIMNGMLAILVFIPGLFWGWLYSRHQNLIGVSISHLLIGWTLLFFLDLASLF